jgi:hypothetical protein
MSIETIVGYLLVSFLLTIFIILFAYGIRRVVKEAEKEENENMKQLGLE